VIRDYAVKEKFSYAFAVRDGADLWLCRNSNRSNNDVYVEVPIEVDGMTPHVSMHGSGQQHMVTPSGRPGKKRTKHPLLPIHVKKPDASLTGTQPVAAISPIDAAETKNWAKKPDPTRYREVLEIDLGLLTPPGSLGSYQCTVEVNELKANPFPFGFGKVVFEQTLKDRVPWIRVTVWSLAH
jgi:hypothetical protein